MIDPYIRQYGRRLYGLCLSLCANSVEADDLYQETWLKVLRHIDQYDPSQEFEPWLTRICVNTHRDALRRIARLPLLTFADNSEQEIFWKYLPAPEKPDYLPLYEAIRQLPRRLRTVIVLYYFRDKDLAQTASILGIPVGTVKSRLSKARKRLKEELSDGPDL